MRRRALLAAIGLSATAPTAGCLSSVLGRDDQQIRLAQFSAENFDTEPHQFDLRVERDGETVHRSTHEIRGKSDGVLDGAVVDCDWGGKPGAYEVSARVDGAQWASERLANVRDGRRDSVACATARVEYHENGQLGFVLRADCGQFADAASTGVCAIADETTE